MIASAILPLLALVFAARGLMAEARELRPVLWNDLEPESRSA